MYQKISNIAEKFFTKAQIFKYGFNFSPMYRRSTGKIYDVSDDLLSVSIKIPRSWRNKNYVGSIFGGSLFSATDPIYMIQLVNILGKNYVVWDKSANIRFRKPAFTDAYAQFVFTDEEIETIKEKVSKNKEIDYTKTLAITAKDGSVFSVLEKTLYIADKHFYKEKRRLKRENKSQ